MNKKNYIIKSKALADIQTISDYIAQDKKSAALKLIERSINLLKNLQNSLI